MGGVIMNLELRKDVMTAKDSNIIYVARNLVCDGTNWFDTGFAPFSTDNANVDFMLTIRFNTFETVSGSGGQESLFTCKYEGTLSGQQWPGFLIRRKSGGGGLYFDIGGYSYWQPTIAALKDSNLYFWRKSGTFYAKSDSDGVTHTLSVRLATFDQNIIIGAAEQTNGTKFRYGKSNINYVRLEYI